MAELGEASSQAGGLRLASQQLRAVAWLRWRILANGFRRKGGAGELIGRILLLPLFASLALTPTLLAGFVAWFQVKQGSLGNLSFLFWAAFAMTQLLNINTGQPGTTFDPTELIRFPMALRNYVLVRLSFGVLSPANVIVALMSVAIFIGITVNLPRLWLWTLLATAAFALANVLFSRMIFAWVDRWLSTRRAREIFTGLIFAASLGFQYLNVTYNPGFQHGRQRGMTPQKIHHAQQLFARLHPWLASLPPELTGQAVVSAYRGQLASSLIDTACVGLYAAAFLAVYSLRMRTEYHGENLSDRANAVARIVPKPLPSSTPAILPELPLAPAVVSVKPRLLPNTLAPLLAKELLVLRRNTGLLYGVIAPTVMVFLFAGRLSLRGGSHWLLPTAAAYAMLGLAPGSYNSFGLEGPGAQLYFMAPVPLREVFFAKNCMHFLLALFEVFAVISIISYAVGRPRAADIAFVLLWAIATLLFNTALGNLRSVSAPKKVNPGRAINRTQSQVSAWIAMGVLAGSAGLGAAMQFFADWLHRPWLSLALVATFALAAFFTYRQGLRGIEAYAMNRREALFEELGKKT